MASLNLLPDTTQLALERLIMDETSQQLTATAMTTAREAACPLCQRFSSKVHSHYTRAPVKKGERRRDRWEKARYSEEKR